MKTCFVVMAIGDQVHNGESISANDLKEKYDGLIKESIESISDEIKVIRADEISNSGSISSEIFKKLILSDYVVVDLTYPNPNVFYELGLRHAVRNKTILIKDQSSKNNPFDITTLRYISYKDSGAGLKKLKTDLAEAFKAYDESPTLIDNDFLKAALSMGLCFQKIVRDPKKEGQKIAFKGLLKNPSLLKALENGDTESIAELLLNVENLDEIIDGLIDGCVLED